jgi:hypothetical protein
MLFFQACHDMVVSGKRDHLSVLWTSGPGVSREEVARQLRVVLLVRENAELRWVWGSVDCTGKVPGNMSDVVETLKAFHDTSMASCTKLLDPWRGAEDSGGSNLPGLVELPLPSQMYGTQDLILTGKEFDVEASVQDGSPGDAEHRDDVQPLEEVDAFGPDETGVMATMQTRLGKSEALTVLLAEHRLEVPRLRNFLNLRTDIAALEDEYRMFGMLF